jgi:cell division protein FtsB
MTRLRWAALVIALVALVFAIEGGEYSTGDLLTLRREAKEQRAAVAGLKAEIDSLQKVAVAVEHDPAEQERIAREEFGMLRKGEYLYRLLPPDSTER